MSWKKLLESVSESLNDHIQLRNDYLMAENRILRDQIDGRVQLTDSHRKELAEMGAKLGKKALAEIATIAKPDTILAWNRKFADPQVHTSEPPQSVGRPRVDQEIEDLVVRMARENRSWGYDRIQGVLNHLGYTISDQTVGNILKRHHISPAPERQKTVTWKEVTRSHLNVLMATGFFDSEVWNRFGLILTCLLSFVDFCRHSVQSVMMRRNQQVHGVQFQTQCLNLSPHTRRWRRLIPERSRARETHQTVVEHMASEVILADARKPRSQHAGKVASLSKARDRQIRDGPLLSGPGLADGYREAA